MIGTHFGNIKIPFLSGIIALLITLVQKYTVDQESLKKIKGEQKLLQEEMKKYKDHPEKLLELQKKQLEFLPQPYIRAFTKAYARVVGIGEKEIEYVS